ncbi:hypothetical protein EXVG_00379 [Emiliania huxleyi virus 202]|nr:hypothetical protein EXVG_00379 [Emiliania huxleyi virus 202]
MKIKKSPKFSVFLCDYYRIIYSHRIEDPVTILSDLNKYNLIKNKRLLRINNSVTIT